MPALIVPSGDQEQDYDSDQAGYSSQDDLSMDDDSDSNSDFVNPDGAEMSDAATSQSSPLYPQNNNDDTDMEIIDIDTDMEPADQSTFLCILSEPSSPAPTPPPNPINSSTLNISKSPSPLPPPPPPSSPLSTPPTLPKPTLNSIHAGTYLSQLPRVQVFGLLLSSYLLHVADSRARLANPAVDPTGIDPVTIAAGLKGFQAYLDKAERRGGGLPRWWGGEARAHCERVVRRYGVEGRELGGGDLGDGEVVLKWRVLAEALVGKGVGGT